MTNKELREYLERFKDEEEVSFVIADPKSRKAYGPEEVFVIFNENIAIHASVSAWDSPRIWMRKHRKRQEKTRSPHSRNLCGCETMSREKHFSRITVAGQSGSQCHKRKKPITDIGCRTDQLSSCVNTSSTTHGGQTNTSEGSGDNLCGGISSGTGIPSSA